MMVQVQTGESERCACFSTMAFVLMQLNLDELHRCVHYSCSSHNCVKMQSCSSGTPEMGALDL